MPQSSHQQKLGFGQHLHLTWEQVPHAYLRWMVDVSHSRKYRAIAELDRRSAGYAAREQTQSNMFEEDDDGVMPVRVAPRVIDYKDCRLLKFWLRLRKTEEGLNQWLVRLALMAEAHGTACGPGIYEMSPFVLEVRRDETALILEGIRVKSLAEDTQDLAVLA